MGCDRGAGSGERWDQHKGVVESGGVELNGELL